MKARLLMGEIKSTLTLSLSASLSPLQELSADMRGVQ